MKAILIIAAILGLCFCLGWMSYSTTDGSTSLTIETDKAKKDTSEAIEKGKELVEESVEKLKGTTSEKLKTSAEDDSDPGLTPLPSQP